MQGKATGGGINLSDELKDKLRKALGKKRGTTLSIQQVIEIIKLFEYVDEDDDES